MARSRVLGVVISLIVLCGQALNGTPASAASAPAAGAPTVVKELKLSLIHI